MESYFVNSRILPNFQYNLENCTIFIQVWASLVWTRYILTSTLHWKSSQSQQFFSTIGTRYFKIHKETDHCKRDIKSFTSKLSKTSKYFMVFGISLCLSCPAGGGCCINTITFESVFSAWRNFATVTSRWHFLIKWGYFVFFWY